MDRLLERGWGEELASVYLDPSIVLQYDVPGELEQLEIHLYSRARVLPLEASAPEVASEIARNLEQQRADDEAERREQEQREWEAQELAERERRLAQQKVVNISDRVR